MNDKPVKTIAEHNAEREEFWKSGKVFKGERVGVKCPKCTGQLLRKNPMPILTTHPPLQIVHCSKCAFTTRILL